MQDAMQDIEMSYKTKDGNVGTTTGVKIENKQIYIELNINSLKEWFLLEDLEDVKDD